MDIEQLRDTWQNQEQKLEATRSLNIAILKELKLDKAKSKINQLLFLPISSLLFFSLLVCFTVQFLIRNLETWYFAFSASIILFFSFAFVFSSVKQLHGILSLDYQQPVTILQRQLSNLKLSILINLKIAAAILPFSPFVGIFVLKVLFDFDATQFISVQQIWIFAGITIILQILALFFSAKLKSKNAGKNYVYWILQGNGSQIEEAKSFLAEIEDFEC